MYYEVELAGNLFGEWSLIRRWGRCHSKGRGSERIELFNDMRLASLQADKVRERMLKRNYARSEATQELAA